MNNTRPQDGIEALIAALPKEQQDQARADLARFTRILAAIARRLASNSTAYAQFQALTKQKNRSRIGSADGLSGDY